MRLLIAAASLVLLSACTSAGQKAANEAQYEIKQCSEMGFEEGSKEYANCRLQLHTAYLQDRSARKAAFIASRHSSTTNCTSLGNSVGCSSY